jgi:hypothetical protein
LSSESTKPIVRRGWGPGYFLCGCQVHGSQIDAHGFQECPEHGCREYGWRSEPRMQLADDGDGRKLLTQIAEHMAKTYGL